MSKPVTRKEFLKDSNVDAFIVWLVKNLPKLEFDLRIKRSHKYVPDAIIEKIVGIDEALKFYCWQTSWTDSSGISQPSKDWSSTRLSYKKLSNYLQQAIDRKNATETLFACQQILVWGGDRDYRKGERGASRFLKDKGKDLPEYLAETTEIFCLSEADLSDLSKIEKMNSMLTKVHAMAARDGLPIYDSRVAAASAALVEHFNIESKKEWKEIPDFLKFPMTVPPNAPKMEERRRVVTEVFENAPDPGSVHKRRAEDSLRWAEAKIRLGWILQSVLEKSSKILNKTVVGSNTITDRMHALEAALFMIGYDIHAVPGALDYDMYNSPKRAKNTTRGAKAQTRTKKPTTEVLQKTAHTLARNKEFRFSGTAKKGIRLEISATGRVTLKPKFLDAIRKYFSGKEWVQGGFNRTHDGTAHRRDLSFSQFIEEHSQQLNGTRLNKQHAARVAAVMAALKLCECKIDKRSVYLRFK